MGFCSLQQQWGCLSYTPETSMGDNSSNIYLYEYVRKI